MPGSLHVVTGIPGTAVQKALDLLGDFAKANGHSNLADPISVDEILRRLADEDVVRSGHSPSSLLAAFELPQSRLRKHWEDALRKAIAKAEEEMQRGRDVVLTLHLSYFHHKYREFIVAANFDLFRRLAKRRVTKVVTLIDDVYDTYARLTARGQAFDRPAELEDAFLDGLTTLTWRANELMVAGGLASALGSRHYVFAAKHPIAALHRLLFSDAKTIYISHPITEIRRLRAKNKMDEAKALVDEIDALVERLSRDYVVFEPTTIDELRFVDFVRNQPPKSGNLTSRWPFERSKRQMAWTDPPTSTSIYSFPIGWNDDARPPVDGSRPAVREFIDTVEKQISARDHWLVEQSDLLVCFRPVFEGHASSGVRTELEYVHRLQMLGVTKRPQHAFVVSPDADNDAFPPRELADEILGPLFDHRFIIGSDDDFQRLKNHLRAMASPDARLVRVLQGNVVALQELLGEYSLELDPLADGGVMGNTRELRRDDRAYEIVSNIADKATLYLNKLAHLLDVFPDTESMLAKLHETYPSARSMNEAQRPESAPSAAATTVHPLRG